MKALVCCMLVFFAAHAFGGEKEDCVQVCVDALNKCPGENTNPKCGFDYTKCENACTKKYGGLFLDRPLQIFASLQSTAKK